MADHRIKIGVLALQGAFSEHIHLLQKLPSPPETVEIRTKEQLEDPTLDGLILPGGESTTMALVAERSGVLEPLRRWVKDGRPVWGTCAGMILLSNTAIQTKRGGQALIGGLDVSVKRNAFGAQIDSFVSDLNVAAIADAAKPFPGVFIRAPIIETINPDTVSVLARVSKHPESEKEGNVVAVRQDNILATAFHPELTEDPRFHMYFIDMIKSLTQKPL
ncbi:glutamine amidotransferase subunit pdxT [Phlyctochytrium arcticum]|nr:glutamine amidotransferase subunit pdxT [Phlyctochytrium arcticum]